MRCWRERGFADATPSNTLGHMKRLRIHRSIAAPVSLLLLLSGFAAADESKVIPLSPKSSKDLTILGEGVVGKALPAHPMIDPEKYLNLGPGIWEFEIVAGKTKGKMQKESYAKHADGHWRRTIGDEFVEFITVGSDQSYTKTAETASKFGYRASFEPGIHEAPASSRARASASTASSSSPPRRTPVRSSTPGR